LVVEYFNKKEQSVGGVIMSSPTGTETRNSVNSLSQISLEKLAFLGATLFLIGSSISFYVAYQNLKKTT